MDAKMPKQIPAERKKQTEEKKNDNKKEIEKQNIQMVIGQTHEIDPKIFR